MKFKKSSSPESLGQFQPNLAQCIFGWKGFKFIQMKNHSILVVRGDNGFFLLLINIMILSNVLIDLNCFLRWAMWPMDLLFLLSFLLSFYIIIAVKGIFLILIHQKKFSVDYLHSLVYKIWLKSAYGYFINL